MAGSIMNKAICGMLGSVKAICQSVQSLKFMTQMDRSNTLERPNSDIFLLINVLQKTFQIEHEIQTILP